MSVAPIINLDPFGTKIFTVTITLRDKDNTVDVLDGGYFQSNTSGGAIITGNNTPKIIIEGNQYQCNAIMEDLKFIPSADYVLDLGISYYHIDDEMNEFNDFMTLSIRDTHDEFSSVIPDNYTPNEPLSISFKITDKRPDNIDNNIDYSVDIKFSLAEDADESLQHNYWPIEPASNRYNRPKNPYKNGISYLFSYTNPYVVDIFNMQSLLERKTFQTNQYFKMGTMDLNYCLFTDDSIFSYDSNDNEIQRFDFSSFDPSLSEIEFLSISNDGKSILIDFKLDNQDYKSFGIIQNNTFLPIDLGNLEGTGNSFLHFSNNGKYMLFNTTSRTYIVHVDTNDVITLYNHDGDDSEFYYRRNSGAIFSTDSDKVFFISRQFIDGSYDINIAPIIVSYDINTREYSVVAEFTRFGTDTTWRTFISSANSFTYRIVNDVITHLQIKVGNTKAYNYNTLEKTYTDYNPYELVDLPYYEQLAVEFIDIGIDNTIPVLLRLELNRSASQTGFYRITKTEIVNPNLLKSYTFEGTKDEINAQINNIDYTPEVSNDKLYVIYKQKQNTDNIIQADEIYPIDKSI